MLEDPDILKMFIDKCCIFMGDFMNGKGTGETIDLIKAEAMEEFVAHRDKYNTWSWVGNRTEITNKFNDAKKWAEGRPNYFYQHIGNQWNLGTPVALKVNESGKEADISINGIKLSKGTFDGKFFANRELSISATAAEGQEVKGWKLTGGKNQEVSGSELTIKMTSSALTIEPIIGVSSGIETILSSDIRHQTLDIYDLLGNKIATPQKGRIYIQNGKKITWQ